MKNVNNKNNSAVIFDMDGTMIDTEKIKDNAWKYAGNLQNIIITDEIISDMRGTNRIYCKELLCKKFKDINLDKLYKDRYEFVEKYIRENGIKKKEGLDEILKFLKNNDYKIAVASSSEQETIERYLSRINIFHFFDVIIGGDMVHNGKPNPEIYLKAVEQLNVFKEDCIGIEDSNSGILSVHRAGIRAIMIPDLEQPTQEVENILYKKVNSLLDIIKLLEKKV